MAASMCRTAGNSIHKIFNVIIFSAWVTVSLSAKLNAPKVLLPYYSSVVANFTLRVEFSPEESQVANCYRWRSARPEVAQVYLINSTDGECASIARVSAISKTPHQMTTAIVAENRVTKEALRCNVIVGEIVRLEIETTTRLLYLEDSPEELIVRGFDSEGNVFSSLEGLLFEWSLVADSDGGGNVVDAHNILRIKRFSESHYTTPYHIIPLEEHGLQGDTILVEGIRTGSARCSARLKDITYKGLTPSEVRIVVVANLMLSPPDAYVLRHAHVTYTVELLRHNSLKEISMPSPQYYLEVKDKKICSLDPESSIATALDMGSTEIVLKDKNVIMSEFFPQPSAVLHVVSPGFLTFVVLPGRKWVLETGREYEIYIEMYDTDSHRIFPSDNVRVEAGFPGEYFKLLFSSNNGTYHRVHTVARGDTTISGKLTAVIGNGGARHAVTPEVAGSQDVEIYDHITTHPPMVIFPWDPVSQGRHTLTAQAEGGSGEYMWGSTDATTATVTIHGQIITVGPGRSNITAADAKNPAHTGTLVVHVLPPSQMSFPATRVEAAVGKRLAIPVILSARLDGKILEFTDCRQLPLNVTFSDSSVFKQVQATEVALPVDGGCTVLHLQGERVGHTLVTVTYRAPKVLLQASVTTAAYSPLKPVDPEREAVIAVATSKTILFQGGPQPWVLDSSKYFTTLSADKSDLVSIQQASNNALSRGSHIFIVMCRSLGEQILTLTVGNGVTTKNRFPVSETASVRFVCARPVELHLLPVLSHDPELPPCPVTHELHLPIPVHYGKELRLQVTLTDSTGRHLQNISSLALEWSLSTASLATILHSDTLQLQMISSDEELQVLYYQTLRPHNKMGSIVVTATVSHYKQHYLRPAGIIPQEQVLPPIKKALALVLVEEAVITPETFSIFNHPSNKVTMEIQGGSGYFHVPALNSAVLQGVYLEKSHTIMVSPLHEGSQIIQVFDLCLEVDQHPTAVVYVSGVGNIQVTVQDKVEVFKEITAAVKVLDAYGHALLSSLFTLMGLTLQSASDIVSIRPLAGLAEDQVSGLYAVTGMKVGHTVLTASARLPDGQMLNSVSKPIEVFPPLRLRPANITLIAGATFQVIALGGPQSQSIVQFSVFDPVVTSVSSTGILTALALGTTKVVGKAIGLDPLHGESIIYSQDEAAVTVVELSGIRIHAPLSRLQTGSQMPVYAMGLTEQDTPFTFGSSIPPLNFTWTLNSREVVTLKSVYLEKGIRLEAQHSFAQQVFAVGMGHVTLGLEVRTRGTGQTSAKEKALKDDLLIQVFDPLQLTMPDVCAGRILLMPNTDTLIHTNRDAAALMGYAVVTEPGVEAVVHVDINGQLTAGSTPGQAFVRVTAAEDFGYNQTLMFLVQVKPLSYLMLNLDTDLYVSGSPLPGIPVGAVLQFSVSYHDDVGQTFRATNIQLSITCNRYDLLHVSSGGSNNTLVVRAAEVGHTILRVWDKDNPWVSDFVSVPVVTVISPPSPVLVRGSVLCFSTPFHEEKGVRGEWKSSGRSVQVDSKTGLVRAADVGQSSLSYQISPDIITNTEVTVVPAETVTLQPKVKFLTGSPNGSVFIPIVLSAGGALPLTEFSCHSNVSEDGVQSQYGAPVVTFICDVHLTNLEGNIEINEIFSSEPVLNLHTGEHGCLIRSVGTVQTLHQLSTVTSSAELHVRLVQEGEQEELASNVVSMIFLPAFHVQTSELHLTTTNPRGDIHLNCVPTVAQSIQVVASDPVLEVLTAENENQGRHLIVPVRLKDAVAWEHDHVKLFVEITSAITSQHHRVPVSVQLPRQKSDPRRQDLHKQEKVGWGQLLQTVLSNSQLGVVTLLVIVLATAAVVLVGYRAVVGPRYNMAATPNVFLNQTPTPPSPQHPFLQSRTSPSGSPNLASTTTTPSRLWSVSPAQQDTSFSLHQRSAHTFSRS